MAGEAVNVLAAMNTAVGALRLKGYVMVPDDLEQARSTVRLLAEAASNCAEAFSDYLEAEIPEVVGANYPSVATLRAALAAYRGEA